MAMEQPKRNVTPFVVKDMQQQYRLAVSSDRALTSNVACAPIVNGPAIGPHQKKEGR